MNTDLAADIQMDFEIRKIKLLVGERKNMIFYVDY